MNNSLIGYQYSTSVQLAQNAEKLTVLANEIRSSFIGYPLPKPLVTMGLKIESDDEISCGLLVSAHGMLLHGRFDHVWFKRVTSERSLAGRLRFFLTKRDGTEEEVYTLLFNENGEVLIAKLPGSSFGPGGLKETPSCCLPEVEETYRRLALRLAAAIHERLDVFKSAECE